MSDDVLKIIPSDPAFVPDASVYDRRPHGISRVADIRSIYEAIPDQARGERYA